MTQNETRMKLEEMAKGIKDELEADEVTLDVVIYNKEGGKMPKDRHEREGWEYTAHTGVDDMGSRFDRIMPRPIRRRFKRPLE